MDPINLRATDETRRPGIITLQEFDAADPRNALRRRIGAVMTNLDLWEIYNAAATKPGVSLADHWRLSARAAWHFDEMERLAAEFFPEPAEQRQSLLETADTLGSASRLAAE